MGIFDFFKSKFHRYKLDRYMNIHDKRIYKNGNTYIVDEKKGAEIKKELDRINKDFGSRIQINRTVDLNPLPLGAVMLSKAQDLEYNDKLLTDFKIRDNGISDKEVEDLYNKLFGNDFYLKLNKRNDFHLKLNKRREAFRDTQKYLKYFK